MYDAGKTLVGIALFVLIVSFPFWYHAASGTTAKAPEPKIVTQAESCVMPTEYMRANHMELLNTWRDEVVRKDERVFTAFDGTLYNKSLSNTCMNCHPNKAEFCDACHNYSGITPYCWDCHVEPKETPYGN